MHFVFLADNLLAVSDNFVITVYYGIVKTLTETKYMKNNINYGIRSLQAAI